MSMNCPACRRQIHEGDKRCLFCGVQVYDAYSSLVKEGYLSPHEVDAQGESLQAIVDTNQEDEKEVSDGSSDISHITKHERGANESVYTIKISKRFLPPGGYFSTLFFAVLLTFTYLILYRLGDSPTRTNEFFSYYLLLRDSLRQIPNLLILSVPIAVFLGAFLGFLVFHKGKRYLKSYFVYSLGSVVIIFVAINASFLVVNIFAIAEVTVLEYKLYQYPLDHSLVWDPEIISDRLSERQDMPRIIAMEGDINKRIVADALKQEQRSPFYRRMVMETVISLYPVSLAIPHESAFVMFEDNLYIRNFEGTEFQMISPNLGRLLIRNTFSGRDIKDVPFIETLTQEKYKGFRIHQINKHLRYLADLVDKLEAAITAIKADMSRANGNISYYRRLAASEYSIGDSTYSLCINAQTCTTTWIPRICGGYYYSFSCNYPVLSCEPRYTNYYCSSQRDDYYSRGDDYIDQANYWVGQYNYHVGWLNKFVDYRDQVKLTQSATEDSKQSIPFELGVFYPKDSIKIAMSSTKSSKAGEYLSTLAHEYLHYTSYVSDEKQLSKFFEESLTEYFSRKVQRSALGSELNLGYPLMTTFISRLMGEVSQHDLEEAYFAKDSEKIYALLDERFGKDFYKENEFYFDVFPYMPSDLGLEVANGILEKVKLQKIEPDELLHVTSLTRYQ